MKALRVAIAIGIAILLPLLAQMSVRIFAEPPVYSEDKYVPTPKTAVDREQANVEHRRRVKDIERKEAAFNLVNFYVSFPLGILELFLGVLARKRPTIAGGVIFGGLSTVACGSYSSWETLPGWARYVSLLFALLVLFSLAFWIDHQAKTLPAES